ncbi:hypothetical protein MTX26_04365 [Bradyrhizobium sp. ISRA443]|uniref:hypothetical protein n=1 Tax=unclassified Bradyrhizobium TaxID=2631580 RepID=UPI002478792B|nr:MULTISPECIES: hypothetical protein [unclassified Bradyrhizobium]WGR95177.1 hypothetical protein MTX20_14500 [Bradyrhizobium sp. ISRA435]WGS00098.1 hypothetical protein MTX23_04365 [Bradyrhizobium sp. ISRA436]WGS06987.1 hypothetical protein MTX18_04365 [Bradyrhizobium sp. ISRA437]WGS13869.1 hypothetical protein MTX26_04365 [Bradyrhizobium sp. ISRA443]
MTRKPCPADLGQQIATILALVSAGERITIATAAKRTGIPADTITIILAIYYAVTDEVLKQVDPLGQSRH